MTSPRHPSDSVVAAPAPPLARLARLASGRPARWARRVAIGLAALALLSWIALPPILTSVIQRQGSDALGRTVTVGAAHFNPLTLSVTLDRVAVAGRSAAAPPLLEFEQLAVDLEWRSLWLRAPVIRSIELHAPHLRLARSGEGHYDVDDLIERLARPSSAPAGEPARFAIYNVQVDGGTIDVDDQPVRLKHRIGALSLGVPFISNLPGDTEVKIRPQLSFTLDGARFDSQAQAQPFTHERPAIVHLHTGDVALGPWLPYWPQALGWRPTGGVVRADLALEFHAPPNGVPQVALSGTLGVDGLALVDAQSQPLLGWQRLAIDAKDIRPFARELTLRRVALAGLTVDAVRDAQGRINLATAFAGPTAPATAVAASAAAPTAGVSQVAAAASSAATAVPAPSWHVAMDAVELDGARIGWRDASVAPTAHYQLQDLQLRVDDLRWPLAAAAGAGPASSPPSAAVARAPAPGTHVHLQARFLAGAAVAASAPAAGASAAGAGVVVDGHLRAAGSELAVQVMQWPLQSLQPYLQGALRPQLEGLFSADLAASWDGALSDGPARLSSPTASIDGLKLREAGRTAPALAWQRLAVEDLRVDPVRQTIGIGHLTVVQPDAWIERDAQGALNLARWLVAAPTAHDAPAARPWQVQLSAFALSAGRVHWRDAPAGGEVQLDVDRLQVALGELRWPAAARDTVALTLGARVVPGGADMATSASSGRVDFTGRVGLNPLSWDGQLRTERVPLHLADPYLAAVLPLQVRHADLGWRGSIQGQLDDAGLAARVRGEGLVTDMRSRARSAPVDPALAEADDLVSWQSLAVHDVRAALQPGQPLQLQVGDVKLVDASTRLVVTEQGRFNLTDLAPAAGAASAPAAPAVVAAAAAPASAASAAADLPDIRIGGLQWVNARVDFTDRFAQPHYSADLSALNGTLGGFSTRSPDLAELVLQGRIAGTGQLDVQGRLNPLARPLALDVQARATDIELAPLSPYAGKYAGYAIDRGKLSMDVKYLVKPDGQLQAGNRITLNQLTFGERVDSPDATHLPVLFAVALLKDRNGVIDVNLPIGGSINDPQFSVGGVVVKLIVNLLTKALMAPFSLLSGGGSDDLSQVLFEPGTATPVAGADKVFDQVAKALTDRPALQLTITGLADDAIERNALQAALLEARLLAMRRTEVLQAGQSEAPVVGALSPADRARLVKRLYDDTRLPDKPRNVIGLAKDLPLPEMETRLRAGLLLPADAMRTLAIQRSTVVRDALAARGLPNERVFVASPKLHGAGDAEPEAWLPHAQLALSTR